MVDIVLNPSTRDIDISDNSLSLTTGFRQEARQRIITALQIYLTEWYANTSYGLPYIQQFLTRQGRNRNLQSFIDNSVMNYIESLNYVQEVSELNSTVSTERLYTLTMSILLVDGTDIELNSFDFNLEI